MDEMKIVSKFTRGIISKALKMVIRKKTGWKSRQMYSYGRC